VDVADILHVGAVRSVGSGRNPFSSGVDEKLFWMSLNLRLGIVDGFSVLCATTSFASRLIRLGLWLLRLSVCGKNGLRLLKY